MDQDHIEANQLINPANKSSYLTGVKIVLNEIVLPKLQQNVKLPSSGMLTMDTDPGHLLTAQVSVYKSYYVLLSIEIQTCFKYQEDGHVRSIMPSCCYHYYE